MAEDLVLNKKQYDADDYDAVKHAIDKLMSASEEQFEDIKKEKWYNRVFDMITFSKKKDIRIAEQIGNLAQAQQIFLEIVLRMSNNDVTISEMLSTSFEDIRKLQGQNLYLLERIQKLENVTLGIKEDMDISKLSVKEKEILCGCLYCINYQADCTSDYQKIYANTIFDYLGMTTQMDNPWSYIDGLENNTKKKILLCCLEYIFLFDCSNDNYEKYDQIISEFDFGNKTISSLKNQINSLFRFRGVEGFYSKYNAYLYEKINDSFSYNFDTGVISETSYNEDKLNIKIGLDKDELAINYFLQFDLDKVRSILEDGNLISPRGMYLLRYIYNWDLSCFDNMKAYDFLEQGYLQGDVLCSVNYARTMCTNREKTEKILKDNIENLTNLCEKGDVLAKYEYILVKEHLDEISEEEVDSLFKEIIDKHPFARFVYARRCFYKEKYDISFSIFNQSIFSTFPEAKYYLGLYYKDGLGNIVEKNLIKARNLFEEAFLGKYDCCLQFILTALEIDKKKETKEKIIKYANIALEPYYNAKEGEYSSHYSVDGSFQDRWAPRKKYSEDDDMIAYFLHLFLLEKYEEKKAADALCLAASLDEPTALLKIARLKSIKHKGLILGTFIDDCTFEESELKKAFWEFKYNVRDAKEILERVEKLELGEDDREELRKIKEKID